MPSVSWTLGGAGTANVSPLPDRDAADLFGSDKANALDVDAGGDYRLVSGEEALREAVLRRLLVRPGEYKIRPSYGVGVGMYVKRAMSKATRDELRLRILDNLSHDDRIDRVLDATVEPVILDGKPGLRVSVVVQAFGREFRFRPFDIPGEV